MEDSARRNELDFSGFKGENGFELSFRLHQRKLYSIEETVNQVLERLGKSECEQKELRSEVESLRKELRKAYMINTELEEENISLRKQLQNEVEDVRKCKEVMKNSVKVIEEHKTVWAKHQKNSEESFKKIMETQQRAKDEMKNNVVSVIKEKAKVLRESVDRVKCVVVFGIEENIVNRIEREAKEKEKVDEMLKEVVDEENQAMSIVEEFHRIGKYEIGKVRPMKIKFVTQMRGEEIISNA